MKKILLSAALVSALAFTSCKKETKIEPTVETTTTDAPIIEDTADVAEDINLVVPTLKSAEAQSFLTDYTTFVTDFQTATTHKDAAQLAALGPKINEYALKAQELAKKIPAEDAVAFNDYV